MSTPERDISITLDLAHRLLADQQPALADRTLVVAGEGWDNVMIRIGVDLALRLPRRWPASNLIRNEQRWLPILQSSSSIPLPVPVWDGLPTSYYPYAWSVVPWFHGSCATEDPLTAPSVAPFATFLRDLHSPGSDHAPQNTFRNQPLTAYGDAVERRLSLVGSSRIDIGVSVASVRTMWDTLHRAAIDVSPTWIHGDLHPNNLVSDNGVLVAVIDWGDLTVGDPSVDLSSAWSVVDPSDHSGFWASYGPVSRSTHDRARAWAIHFALLWIVDAADVDPTFRTTGRDTIARLFSEEM